MVGTITDQLSIRNITKKDISALILSGGKGSRMDNRDKGLVMFQNRPLVEHVISRLKPQVDDIYISANRNLKEYGKYLYPVITDQYSNYQGPLSGIASALTEIDTNYLLIVPCDGPFLPADLVERFLIVLNSQHVNYIAAHDGDFIQPTYCLVPKTSLSGLRAYIRSGERKLSKWLTHYKAVTVNFSDSKKAFLNINTLEQLDKLGQMKTVPKNILS